MKRIRASFVLITVIAIAFGCASDIVLEEPPSLKGIYKGKYIVTRLDQGTEEKQVVRWTFEDIRFHMDIDVDDPISAQFDCICNYDGAYSVEDKVKLIVNVIPEVPGGLAGCDACKDEHRPEGAFDLIRTADSLKLAYLDAENQIMKEILLVPATE